MLVAEAMTSHPISFPPTAQVKDAAAAMRDNEIGDVLVLNRGGDVYGIITDRDLAVRVMAEGKRPTTKLQDVCTPTPVTIGPGEGVEQAVALMEKNAIRRLPVVNEEGKAVGVISLGDAAIKLDRTSALAEISRKPANG